MNCFFASICVYCCSGLPLLFSCALGHTLRALNFLLTWSSPQTSAAAYFGFLGVRSCHGRIEQQSKRDVSQLLKLIIHEIIDSPFLPSILRNLVRFRMRLFFLQGIRSKSCTQSASKQRERTDPMDVYSDSSSKPDI